MGHGLIIVSALPSGRYMIYYLRPESPQRLLKTANVKLERVGNGKEFNIWYLAHDEDSINSDKIRAQNTAEIALHCFESVRADADTPKVFNSLSDIDNEEGTQDLKSLCEIQPISDENESPRNDQRRLLDRPPIKSNLTCLNVKPKEPRLMSEVLREQDLNKIRV